MITYRCAMCGEEMESPRCLIDKYERCPSCRRRNLVRPKSYWEARERKEARARARQIKRMLKQQEMQRRAVEARKSKASKFSVTCADGQGNGHGRDSIVARCKAGLEISLRPEPENSDDICAVGVCVPAKRLFGGMKLRRIGYVPRRLTETVFDLLQQGYGYEARIRSIDTLKSPPTVSVKVDWQ